MPEAPLEERVAALIARIEAHPEYDSVTYTAEPSPKMEPEAKAAWLKALRGGGYEQGRGRLRLFPTGFCCLGVLCDTLAPEGWRIPSEGTYRHGGSGVSLPKQIALKAGITTPTFQIPIGEGRLTTPEDMNDTFKFTFEEIADMIEATL